MKVYLVGGAVRDRLLGLPVRERDWVVVGATEAEMRAAGYLQPDSDFPVFLHPETGEEYALARIETKVGPGYKGFRVETGPHITLEQDLKRRDLTINAMAEDVEAGEIIDPFGGRGHLDEGLLRHITPAFVEDPLRLLRAARFTARFGHFGFHLAHGTYALLRTMAAAEELLTLPPERIWREMRISLEAPQPWRFFVTLYRCGALTRLIPEFAVEVSRAHEEKALPEPFTALQRVAAHSSSVAVRFAVVMYYPARQAREAGSFCRRLRAEREGCDLLTRLLALAPRLRAELLDAEAVMTLLEQGRALQQPQRFEALLTAAAALWPESAGQQAKRLRRAREAAASVTAETLAERGLQGPALGAALRAERVAAIQRAL